MELKLEVVLSSSIKRKKPWPRFCWLGQEKESVFLLDDKRISEINMVSGRTKKRTPKLHPLLNSVLTMTSSHNGMWLCGLLLSGELFLWNRDRDLLKTAAAVPEVVQIITSAQENSSRLALQVSEDGMRVLILAITGQVLLWQCVDARDLTGLRDGPVKGQWAHIQALKETVLPSLQDKEASQHVIFIKTEVMGDTCLSAFVFTSGNQLIITVLKIQWKEGSVGVGSLGYSIQWATKKYPMSQFTPPCKPVKSRGALIPAFSPDGRLLAIVLNQRKPKATQVLFVSTQNFVSISSGLGGCGSKRVEIPSKYIRSYWVGSASWSPGGLFLACVLKRGSLLILARLGGLLTLTSSGCNVDFGPAHFLPLHPLVTYRSPMSARNGEASLSSSSMSVRDIMRQRYSVTWHPRLLYLIVSDGYMATVMRVLGRPSPAILLKSLLKDACKDLEKVTHKLEKTQGHVKDWLESVSCLNLDSSLEEFKPTVTCRPNTTESVISAGTDGARLPLFLQDQWTLGGTKELLENMQALFEDESDLDVVPAGSHVEDGGRLEFASMFDTLHALDTHTDTVVAGPDYDQDFTETEKKIPLHHELGKIQSRLLTAWAFCMSLGNAVEHRVPLLKHTLCCVVRFAALLHLMSCSMVHAGDNTSASTRFLHLIKTLLSFLPWDSISLDGPHCLGLVVDFSKMMARLLLTPHPYQTGHCHISSQSLSRVLDILQLVSDSLDHTYSLKQKTVWSSEKQSPSQASHTMPSDVYHVPLLQDDPKNKSIFAHQAQPLPQRPSSRLLRVWQLVYNITQQYAEELKRFKGCDGWEDEEHQLSVIMSQIQTALQATGEMLEEGPELRSYPGEHLFLYGLYPKSADTWKLQICQEAKKGCGRSIFQETRLCLSLLYSLLSQYHLREAQELGDHMAQLILLRTGHQKDSLTCITAESLPCSWLPKDLHSDAACAVVQTLGRFMASYFTNQPLCILPAHNVAVLPPLHMPHAPSVGRLVPLCQEEVSRAVRQQHLSELWTVNYAQDLLLLGGLLPEAVWLAYHLGDWKTAVSLSLAYTSYCTEHFDFTWLRRRELHLPTSLKPESIFQAELECLLVKKVDSQEYTDKDGDKSFTDPLEGEDWKLLQASIQEILKASVMAGVNVMSSPMSSLLDTAKTMCSSLPALVPTGLYLPSPPLYCPQPSPNTQDQIGTTGHLAEVAYRHKVSGVLQRLLLLVKSGHCCHPAAQWYISHLRRARHILYKIKKKYSYPSAAQEEKAFPEGLMKFISRGGYFRLGPKKDGHLDCDTIHTIACFRELCALCWMLHVRDQLSIHCRRYQAARQHSSDEQISGDSEINSACIDALCWACRLLPFSCFLNAEEILQDILLSLISELPPVSMVADTLVRAFPKEEESVRVPLREKYNSLLQRLKQCNVLGEKEEVNELMMIVIQDKFRQRRKHLARLQRHLAPPVLQLWEKVEQEEDKGSRQEMAMLRQLSLGTTLSTCTVTDCELQPMCSDVNPAETKSEAVSSEQRYRFMTRDKCAKRGRKDAKKTTAKTQNAIQEDGETGKDKQQQLSIPVVGTWEFELEDEEYLNFLELFLSYVLEKNSSDGADSGSELPLLKGFCSELRERELHSLTFDVLTTIHRRQRDGHGPLKKHSARGPPVFRAGCCYKPVKENQASELQTSSVWSEVPISRVSLSVSSQSGHRTRRQKGLFGLRQQSNMPLERVKEVDLGLEISPIQNVFTTGQPSESLMSGSSVSVEAVTELQQGLDPKLEAQFPKLGRLLEWMVRWADRRVLFGHHSKTKKDKKVAANEGVVIRVKASAPAILTSLSLLQWKHTSLLGNKGYCSRIQVPEMQWTVAPVLQPEVDRKLERESSVDTGYPGSANTPVTGLDYNLQGEPFGSHTYEAEELTFQRTHLPADHVQPAFDSQQRHVSSQQLPLDVLDVTPEKEGRASDSEGLGLSSSGSSGNVSGNICSSETSLKLADLDYSEKLEAVSSSFSIHSGHPAPPTVQPKTDVNAELSELNEVQLPNTTVDPPVFQPQNFSGGAPSAESTTPNLPLTTSSLRQRLGEDLLRLVQHVNYMSLSDVLEATFANLQLVQQNSSTAQSNRNASHLNVPSSSAANLIPEPNVLPIQTTFSAASQMQTCVPNCDPQLRFADQPAMQSSAKTSSSAGQYHANQCLSFDATGVNYQEMQPLCVKAESPDIQQRESRRLIPPSQGLLATTGTRVNNGLSSPVLLVSNGNAPNDSASQVPGLKLLKLHHPPLMSQHSTPHCPPAQQSHTLHTNPETLQSCQHKSKQDDQSTWKKKRGGKSDGFSVSRKHLCFNPPHDPTPRNSHSQIWASGTSSSQGFSLLPPAFPAHTQTPMEGLRLLQLQQVPHTSTTFPKLPLPSYSRPAFIAAPMTETPMIKLLHLESAPKIMLPQAVPSTQVTRLFSVAELTSSGIRRWDAKDPRLQLLRADQPSGSTREPINSSSCTPSKRQKRREEKATGRKTGVTFRPNDSIIPTQEAADVPVSEESPVAEEITTVQDITGSSDSLLTGQRLLDKVFSTSAELHAFASTSKQPPECQDAFTNTEPVCPPMFVDKTVSAQASIITSGPTSQSSKDGQIYHEDHVQDSEETSKDTQKILDLCGRQFISVLDLEDVIQHEDLLPCFRPDTQDVSSDHRSSPTSAELHVLATSVIGRAAAVTIPEDPLKPTTPTDIPEAPLLFSYQMPSGVSERNTPPKNVMVDPSDSEICRAIKTQSVLPERASFSPPSDSFSTRLSELDAQLTALQKIADHLEMDFSNSGMPVNTVGELSSDMADVKTTSAVKKTVRLSVPLKAWTPRSDPDLLTELKSYEEDEKHQEEEHVVRNNFGNPGTKPSHYSASPIRHRAGPSYIHTPPEIKDNFSEAFRESHEWTDEDLGQTGLSDTAEILDELIKEGYLSPTDWNWSASQTPHHTRQDQLQNSRTSQKHILPEDERRELRIWMRRKQQEQLAAYQKHRQSLREKELKPFPVSVIGQSTNKNQSNTLSTRAEKLTKEKFALLEQYNQRTLEACSLASDLATSPPVLSTTRSTSAPPPGSVQRAQSLSVNDKRNLESPQLHPQSVEGLSEDLHRRLGLNRPVTFLPEDRLSQVTRRGMITNTKRQAKLHTANQSEEQHVGYRRRMGLNSTYSGGAAVGKGILRQQSRARETAVVDRSISIRLEDSDIVSAGLSGEPDDVAIGGVSEMDWLDNLSECAGSSLSKIDWDAIEKMVAGEED
ncbi:ciliogenesis and planar polarity effector 1 isoform X3 [Melanotaenia boesemani]|uniref:ciliogenesis and planar polarity effector 1 isoform X3 n=1 Tax=Melanotaenia boesemani TaxID=1250792 RepID=UPI001C03C870|nr:ciliogenesis and planar polarity effector 1 isoform X3 [Melanotaenia boesemani]